MRGGANAFAMMLAGGMVAALPATAQAVAGRTLDLHEQAALSIALSVGAFASAILNAALLESRLTGQTVSTPTYIPHWSVALGTVASIALAIAPDTIFVICIAVPILQVALFLGRTHSVVVNDRNIELSSAALLAGGCVASFLLGWAESRYAFMPLAIGAGAAILVRGMSAWRLNPPAVTAPTIAWVTSETAIVALTPFVLNVTVLVLLGPAQAVAFRLVLTVLGVLQPVLGYMRTRLLASSSPRLVTATYVLSAIALACVVLAHVLGLFHVLFGTAWDYVSLAALAWACLWKILTIPETVPFARMRRQGHVSRVFVARSISTGCFVVLGSIGAATGASTAAVFLAFTVAQVITVALYSALARPSST